ncbi:MAG: hypothetical protein RIT81_46710 [Deltaproteobacteria bacterium]
MSTTWKVIIGVIAGMFLLGAGTCVAGYVWFQNNAEDFKAKADQVAAEAGEFAAAHEQSECIDESLRKSDACEGGALGAAMCRGMVSAFLAQCLDQARQTEGLCDGVPEADDILGVSKWAVQRCVDLGRAGDQPCGQLITKVSVHCSVQSSSKTTGT